MHDATDLDMKMKGYGLTTARFLYHLPDHPWFLQTFVWQYYDLAPDYPELFRFIEFWKEELDGALHSVAFTHKTLIAPNEWRSVSAEFMLH